MTHYPDLEGSSILLTGGANGIGEATVRALVQQRATVHFCDTDRTAGRRLERALRPFARFEAVDLRREAQVRRWVRQAAARSGRIAGLVNNAAIDPRRELKDTSTEFWDDLMAVNLRALLLTTREARPFFARPASVVNFASITFHAGALRLAAYVASKGGVIALTRSLARELGPDRIRVNTVSPGWIMTERQIREFVTPATRRLIRRSQCIPDPIQQAEIAEVVLFLLSSASRAVTGQELLADRGWHHS